MPFLNRASDQFQASLDGGPVDPSLLAEVELVASVREMSVGPGPDPAFVAMLAQRLREQPTPARIPQERPRTQPYPSSGRHRYPQGSQPTHGPVVVFVKSSGPRVAASMGASALMVGAVLGVSSRQSMPGQTLYPVSNLIDVAAVALSFSDHDRGMTLLSQAERHIGQAQELAALARSGSSVSPADVQVALEGAIASTTQARQALVDDFAQRGDLASLVDLRDFTLRVTPALATLLQTVPAQARPLAGQLQTAVDQITAGVTPGLGTTAAPVDLTNAQLTSASSGSGASVTVGPPAFPVTGVIDPSTVPSTPPTPATGSAAATSGPTTGSSGVVGSASGTTQGAGAGPATPVVPAEPSVPSVPSVPSIPSVPSSAPDTGTDASVPAAPAAAVTPPPTTPPPTTPPPTTPAPADPPPAPPAQAPTGEQVNASGSSQGDASGDSQGNASGTSQANAAGDSQGTGQSSSQGNAQGKVADVAGSPQSSDDTPTTPAGDVSRTTSDSSDTPATPVTPATPAAPAAPSNGTPATTS